MENALKERLWTRNFVMVSIINFLVTLMFYLLIVIIARFAVDQFGVSTSTAGLVSSIFIIGSLLGRLATGRIITSWGSKKTLRIGLISLTIATVLYFASVNVIILILIRLIHGIAVGIVGTATGTVIAQIIPTSRRGEGIGYFSMSAVLATAIGPFIGILLTQSVDSFNTIFIFNTVLVVICLLMFFTVNFEKIVKPKVTAKPSGFKLSDFIEPKSVPISFIALVIGFAYSGVMSFLSFYSEAINLVEAGSLFFLVYAITILISRPFTGPLMDRRGANIVVIPCLIIFFIGMFLFSQASTGVILLLAACLIGLGYGNFNSVAQTLAIKVTEPHRFGLATSTYFILYDLGLGIGPYLLGYLEPVTGYRTMFLFMLPVIIIALVLYIFLVGRTTSAKAPSVEG